MADAFGDGLVVWKNGYLFRLENPTFKSPVKGNLSTGTHSFMAQNGLLGMDVSPRIFPDEPRFLYFRPLMTHDLFMIDTRQINHFSSGHGLDISGAKNVLRSHGVAHAFSSEGTLFIGMSSEFGVACWNRYRELRPENIVRFKLKYSTYLILLNI